MIKRPQFFRKFSFCLKWSYRYVKSNFDIPTILFRLGAVNLQLNVRKIWESFNFFFGKMSFFEMFLWKNRKQFWQPRPKFFAKKLNFSCAVYERFLKNEQFLNWKVLLEIFLSTGRFQFRQTYWKFIGKRRKFFHSIPENVEKTSNFFQKIVFLRNLTIVSLNAVLKTQEVSRQKVEKF